VEQKSALLTNIDESVAVPALPKGLKIKTKAMANCSFNSELKWHKYFEKLSALYGPQKKCLKNLLIV
jgi:hypothetical protein